MRAAPVPRASANARAHGLVPRQIDATKFPPCILACGVKNVCVPTPLMAMGTNCFCAKEITQCISSSCTAADKTTWTAEYPGIAAIVIIAAILAFFMCRQRKAKQRDAYDMELFKEPGAGSTTNVTPYSMSPAPPFSPQQQQMQQAYPFANGYGPGSEAYASGGHYQQQQGYPDHQEYTQGVIATANGYVQAPVPVAPVPAPLQTHSQNYSLGGSTYPQATGYPQQQQQQGYAQPGNRQTIYSEGHSTTGPTYENSARIMSMYDGSTSTPQGGITPFAAGAGAGVAGAAAAGAAGLAVAGGIAKAQARPPTPTEIYVHERDGGRVGAPSAGPAQPVVNVMPPSYDPSWADDQSTSGTAGGGGRVVATPTRPEKSGLHVV
ncbi:uncharacterized protein LOC62_03G004633 [Vanrija pseudolonga]|uniref:Uncharacterized protein n=1 Tax=Vanrija pseudolonga TaxID=143232 RepID=A0AAF1BQL4_9TREE|nr:hypothetical protein LOC62_03G004633 [Vanrija pseudolonga]